MTVPTTGNGLPERVGIVGLGSMGGGTAARLLDEGVDVVVWNRTAERAEPLAARGARVAETPAEAAASGVVVVSVADEAAVESVLFGPDGIAAGISPGQYVMDASTVSPDFAVRAAERASESGFHYVGGRYLGNDQHARAGELRVLVEGPDEALAGLEPLLRRIAKDVVHVGDMGQAAMLKLLLNMLMAIEVQALAEAVAVGQRAGLSADTVLETIGKSGFSSPVMRFKGQVMRDREFTPPTFRLALMRKDVSLLRAAAQGVTALAPVAEASYEALTGAVNAGLGDQDCAAVLVHAQRQSGVEAEAHEADFVPAGS